MIWKNSLPETASRVAHRLLSFPWKVWFWGDSIGFEGLLDAGELCQDPSYMAYAHGIFKGWLAREQCRSPFDYNAPGVALLRVYESTGDRSLLEGARRHAAYLNHFRKTLHGAFVRYENAAIELPPELPPDHPRAGCEGARPVRDGGPCVFVDSIHFDGPFFARFYRLTGDRTYRDMAVENILPQIQLLWDPEQRLFHHFWMEHSAERNGVLWGRGNGWGLLGVAMTLEELGTNDAASLSLSEVLRESLDRLLGLQDASGAWHTVLDDAESYLETSTAAFFADVMARAICLGLVEAARFQAPLEKALQYALSRTREDGLVDGVSYETFPSTRREYYRQMPVGALAPWGQGPLLTALHSYARMMRISVAEQEHASS